MPHRLALLVVFLWAGLGGGAARGQGDDLARELPRIEPLEPGAALKSFRLHEGFRLQTVASEPLVTDPVSVVYDADGRLYVVEMRGYPYPEDSPTGNVRRLEDRDGDGVFERSTIFVDGLSWPTSVLAHDGGVFIAVPPDILYAKDTDGDGVADEKKVVFTGFGTQNVQALVNGLLWGLDGWIYGVVGGQRRRHPQPGAAGRQARLGPGPRLPVQARRLALRGDLGRRAVRPRLRRLGPPLHLQQQQPHPPDRPARPLPGAEPGARGPGGAHRHRRRRVRRAGLSGSARPSPGGSSGPASARPTPRMPSGSRRPSWSPPASSPRPPA